MTPGPSFLRVARDRGSGANRPSGQSPKTPFPTAICNSGVYWTLVGPASAEERREGESSRTADNDRPSASAIPAYAEPASCAYGAVRNRRDGDSVGARPQLRAVDEDD